MAKTEKVVDLKPELDKITDEQLKGLQEIVSLFLFDSLVIFF